MNLKSPDDLPCPSPDTIKLANQICKKINLAPLEILALVTYAVEANFTLQSIHEESPPDGAVIIPEDFPHDLISTLVQAINSSMPIMSDMAVEFRKEQRNEKGNQKKVD